MYAKYIRLRQKRRGVGVDRRIILNGSSHTKMQGCSGLDLSYLVQGAGQWRNPVNTITKRRVVQKTGIFFGSKINTTYKKVTITTVTKKLHHFKCTGDAEHYTTISKHFNPEP